MSKFSVAMKRFGGFMKRNAFYFLIVLCIASVATVIALAVTHNQGAADQPTLSVGDDEPTLKPDDPLPPADKDDDVPQKQPLSFKLPANGSMQYEYSVDEVVWNETYEEYAHHFGVDFVSEDLNVYAAADGTVAETGYNELDGYYIVINHEEGYQTKYMSLEQKSTLTVGSAIKQGTLIGKMSNSQGDEELVGAHLHFELWKNGECVNPLTVLATEDK